MNEESKSTDTTGTPPSQESTPQQTHSAPPPQTQHPQNGNPLQELKDMLDALPERLASTVKEAMPKPVRQSQPRTEQNNSADSSSQTTANTPTATSPSNVPGKTTGTRRERFHKWWFEG
jgi:hypothetical protein